MYDGSNRYRIRHPNYDRPLPNLVPNTSWICLGDSFQEHIDAFQQNVFVNSATSLQHYRASSTEGPLESKLISNPASTSSQAANNEHQFEIPSTALSAQQVIRNRSMSILNFLLIALTHSNVDVYNVLDVTTK